MSEQYKASGVNLDAGANFSALAAQMRKSTFENCPYVKVHDVSKGDFRGREIFILKSEQYPFLRTCGLAPAADGMGTKSILVDAAGMWRSAAFDVVAMCGGDITRDGGLPIVFSNVLDVSTLGDEHINPETVYAFGQTIQGLADAANQEGVVLLGGETAELGVCVGSENPHATTKFNWAGFMLGLFAPNKMILGNDLRPGQVVVALREQGFRSNGISLVRAAFRNMFGERWFDNPHCQGAIRNAAAPATLYDKFLATANGWLGPTRIPVAFIAHITGGGIKEKFADKVLGTGLSAYLNNLWTPPQVMRLCAQWLDLPDEECYHVWNGGQGALVVLERAEVPRFLEMAKSFDIKARVCGRITQTRSENKPSVVIKSKFRYGRYVRYEAP